MEKIETSDGDVLACIIARLFLMRDPNEMPKEWTEETALEAYRR